MNIFEEIEGLDGENLVSALLRVLLLRSEEIREAIIGLISDKASFGPIAISSHFSCVKEESAPEGAESGTGRIDLMIETDDAVIGLENKLFAGFQYGQPHKYLQSARERAEQLGKLRQADFIHYVVVIAPQSRDAEVLRHIADNKHLISLSWEDVRSVIRKQIDSYDSLTMAIAKSFDEYLADRTAFLPKFAKWVRHLQRSFQPKGSVLQRRVVTELKPMIPLAGTRLGSGDSWVGYYFGSGIKDKAGWFGYVDSKTRIASGAKQDSELILVTSFPLSFPSSDFTEIKMSDNRFLHNKPMELHAWAVNYDHRWNEAGRWRQAFEPLNEQIRETESDGKQP